MIENPEDIEKLRDRITESVQIGAVVARSTASFFFSLADLAPKANMSAEQVNLFTMSFVGAMIREEKTPGFNFEETAAEMLKDFLDKQGGGDEPWKG